MYRECPNCSKISVSVKDLLFGHAKCIECNATVGIARVASAIFSALIFLATIATTLAVLKQFGYLTAIFWFTVPIGSLSYIKARVGPLSSLPGPL